MQMLDACGRKIDYLRISITDRCNLRCIYCMPENGVSSISHDSLLRYEEIVRLVRLMQPLGVQKCASRAANRWHGADVWILCKICMKWVVSPASP